MKNEKVVKIGVLPKSRVSEIGVLLYFDPKFGHIVEVGLTFGVGLTFKFCHPSGTYYRGKGLTIEGAYNRAFTVHSEILCLC